MGTAKTAWRSSQQTSKYCLNYYGRIVSMLSIEGRNMSITIQKSFFGDKYLADTRTKLAELYYKKPDIAYSERKCILEYWSTYEGLSGLLGNVWQPFIDWFLNTTSPETITRCLRSLKEDGTITLTRENQKKRQDRQNEWRQYWSHKRGGNG